MRSNCRNLSSGDATACFPIGTGVRTEEILLYEHWICKRIPYSSRIYTKRNTTFR